MKYKTIISILCAAMALGAQAQPVPVFGGKQIAGQRKYKLFVHEGNDSIMAEFNRGLAMSRGNRSFLTDIAGVYRSTFAGQVIGASTGLLELGVSALVKSRESKQPQWERAVNGESSFVRVLPMQMEILDFYKNRSVAGPLDPSDMYFHGFGCRQVIEYAGSDGKPGEEEVFYVSCSVRTDSVGRMRMLNHSKFEVYVDSLRFNYAICDLPNDSLGIDADKRIGFSFEKRKDLKFRVNAKLTSSWITQAMQVYTDVPLGEFDVVASIDPKYIGEDGVFTYSSNRDKNSGKLVSVSGDCFLVPRSYVGSSEMYGLQDTWGTGQYRVEMRIAETCRINPEYYQTNGKWDKDKWGPEWKLIKSRKHGKSAWKQVLDVVGVQYQDSKWISTLLEPTKTVIIQYETEGLNRLINGASATMPTSAPAVGQASAQKKAQASASGVVSPQGVK